jgi:hypothetical protein
VARSQEDLLEHGTEGKHAGIGVVGQQTAKGCVSEVVGEAVPAPCRELDALERVRDDDEIRHAAESLLPWGGIRQGDAGPGACQVRGIRALAVVADRLLREQRHCGGAVGPEAVAQQRVAADVPPRSVI